MNDVPSSWGLAIFGEINQFSSRTLNPKDFLDEKFELYSVPTFPTGMPEILLGKNIGSTKQIVELEDVLICKINPRINRVWQVMLKKKLRQIASSEWIVMRASELDSRYLRYFFSSPNFRNLICQDVTGVGGSLTRAQPKRVATFTVPLAPLNEQKRIADKLDTVLAGVDTCRECLDRLPAILKRFRQSVLATATSGKLTEEWRDETGGATWNRVTVEQVASKVFDGPFGSHLKSKDYSESGIRVVRLENIGWLSFVADKQTFIPLDKYEGLRKHSLQAQDVLFSSFISEDVRVCLLPSDLSNRAINKADCFCIRVNTEVCLSSFLALRLACRSAFIALEKEVHGATRPHINLGQLRRFTFRLPFIDEQREIIRRVESLFAWAERLEARYTAARDLVARLTPALLAKAFRGELVPQDPNDEPANLLLERIHAARAAAPAKLRRRRTTRKKPKAKLTEQIVE